MVLLLSLVQLLAPQLCIVVIWDMLCVEMTLECVYQLECGQDQYQIVSVSSQLAVHH